MISLKSGFVTLIGRPNVGKSTLLNHLTGEKIAIVSHKPQTTRNKIQSIVTGEGYQVIFVDTPGLHKPKHKLGNYMMQSARQAMNGVDVILFLTDPRDNPHPFDAEVLEGLKHEAAPVFLVINKVDTIEKTVLLPMIEAYQAIFPFAQTFPVSALKGENTDALFSAVLKELPQGPQYFPEGMITDQPERQIVAEIIREKLLKLLEDEIPHGIAVEIMSMKDRQQKEIIDIEATIYCEKESHKGIVIGKKGALLKKVGSMAREDLERFLGAPVYLQLWVKVKEKWRDSDFLLKNFGYNKKDL